MYLDSIMIDMAMSQVKAKKAGDLVAIVSRPEESHIADSTQDMQGCVGHTDCNITLAQAIESSDMPE